mmetsp:Transcript_20334/g.45192  ORF Transcript_20334/g.45192 Transcript_20334/m.45192 type:complete len:501 (-) Transcript_20334:125-1627(-)
MSTLMQCGELPSRFFEKKGVFAEETLEYLDADPFVLFGVDDSITQKALARLEIQPHLLCSTHRPTLDEWFSYLKADPMMDQGVEWVVQSFAETELPTPWTCYKGVGSIVCYVNHTDNCVTWKHPFYDYFAQLLQYCRTGPAEEIQKIRVNRLIWSYETATMSSGGHVDPLLSPEYVEQLGEIFGVDLADHPYLVRPVKAFLKQFAHDYRVKEDISRDEILRCMETLEQDKIKNEVMRSTWEEALFADLGWEVGPLADGKKACEECRKTALSYCLECKDYLCLPCFERLHQKGHRQSHVPFRLIPCHMCNLMPAKLRCSFTEKSLCHECYATRHIKELPPEGREMRPLRINYARQSNEQRSSLPAATMRPGTADTSFTAGSYESALGTDWHQFYDAKGIKYYHNFKTGERMRWSPSNTPAQSQAGTPRSEASRNNVQSREKHRERRASKGSNAPTKALPALPTGGPSPWASGPQTIRPPYRTTAGPGVKVGGGVGLADTLQ